MNDPTKTGHLGGQAMTTEARVEKFWNPATRRMVLLALRIGFVLGVVARLIAGAWI